MRIPYNKQKIDRNDVLAVTKSLSGDLITTGPLVDKFETKIRKYLKCKYAIACSSGTSAIHLALLSADVKKNDIILMPAVNFIASFNMASQIGAKIFLVDVDHMTGQMIPEKIEECIKKNNLKKIKALICMYHGGYPENILKFNKLKKKYKFIIIEDACHALGSSYTCKKKIFKIGSCMHSDICTFSLHPVKSITTGEGGIITTNNNKISKKIKLYRNHGIFRSRKKYWNYDVITNGFNYRISDINCALGISQLKKLDNFIKKRKKVFEIYKKKINNFYDLVKIPEYSKDICPSFHLSLIQINFQKLGIKKDTFINFLNSKNIYVQFHYIPIYKFKIFTKKNIKFPGSEYYYKNTLSLPIFVDLNLKKQSLIINILKNFVKSKIIKK